MLPLFITLAILCLLVLAYLFMLKGRTGHKNTGPMKAFYYAHRGYHAKPEIPENSLSAFQRAVDQGYGAEFDVHLLADGGLAVIHDAKLKRTTGADGEIEDLTVTDLKNYNLEGTTEHIPTLSEVLSVFDGKTPLIIELKSERDNFAALCETTCKALDTYTGLYCIESFDPRCVIWLKRNRPDIMRGQLSGNFIKEKEGPGLLMSILLTYLAGNVLCRPDFIAYDYTSRHNLSNRICRDFWHITPVRWTLRTQKDLEGALNEGALAIFEQFEPFAD